MYGFKTIIYFFLVQCCLGRIWATLTRQYSYAIRGRQQLNFVPINGQLAAAGGRVEVVVRKSVTKSPATIFYIVIKITF